MFSNLEWYGMASDRVSFWPITVPGRYPLAGDEVPANFNEFITSVSRGSGSPYFEGVCGSFNQRHPANEVSRATRDLQRAEQELRTREEAVRHAEAFREFERLNGMAREFEEQGNDYAARRYRSMAEQARSDAQSRLDAAAYENRGRRIPVIPELQMLAETENQIRERLRNEIMAESRMAAPSQPFAIEYRMGTYSRTETFSPSPGFQWQMLPTPSGLVSPKPGPKLELPATGKRSIILEEDRD